MRAWAAQCEPVFICGVERSGTSTLQLALARHPALFAVPDVYETFIFTRPEGVLHDPVPSMTEAYLGGAKHIETWRARYAVAGLGDADLIQGFFHYAAHQVYPGRRPLEKTPSHVRKLALMCELFPKARVIVCTRDPVAVVASYRQRLEKEQGMGLPRATWGWLDRSLGELITHCNTVGAQMRAAAAAHGERLFVAPYEWLTADAEGSLTALCAFAGLAFDEALLAPKPRRGNAVDGLLTRPIAPHQSDVGRHLDADAQDAIRAGTAGLHPLWDTAGPLTALKGGPKASA